MEDSQIVYRFKAEGIEEIRAKARALGVTLTNITRGTNGHYTASGKLASALNNQAGATSKVAGATDRASRSQLAYIGHIAKTTVFSAAINKAFLEIVDVMGQAIQAVDLMNNFPATMGSMGQSTVDAAESMKVLSAYVGSVGGNIQQATSMVTRFTGVTKDVKAATAVYTGLNNALIAGDSSAEEQKQALLQFAQAFERGKPDMREWNSLTQNMSNQLGMVAEKMGYVNSNELGQALRDGEESMGNFAYTLTEMSTGTGAIAQQTMTRMQGMQFAFNVMKNTLVTGLASIIQAIGRNNIVAAFTVMTQAIILTTKAVVGLINMIISLASAISQLLGGPAIGKMQGDTEGVADGIKKGADESGNLKDGLKDAGDEAKELNKSLASFDKMNVLPDKTSGKSKKDDDDVSPGTQFDADQLKGLHDLFDGLSGPIDKAGLAAKILAGVFATLVGIKFAQGIIDQMNGIAETAREAKKNIGSAKTFIAGDGKDKDNIFTRAQTAAKGLGTAIAALAGASLASLANPWVLIGLAIAAVVAGMIYLYNTNEDFRKGFDAVWGYFVESVQNAAEVLVGAMGGAVKWVKEAFEGLPGPIKGVFDAIGKFFEPVIKFWSDFAKEVGLVGPPMEQLGQWVAAFAAGIVILTTAFAIFKGVMLLVNIVTGVFTGIMAILTSPITLVVLAIAAVIAVIVLLIMYWDEIMKVAVDVWNTIASAWGEAYKWFDENFVQPIIKLFFDFWKGVAGIFMLIPEFFKFVFEAAWFGITVIWLVAVEFFRLIWEGIVAVFTNGPTWFANLFRAAWEGVKLIWGVLGTWFLEKWNNLKTNLGNVISFFRDTFQGAWNAVTSIFSGLWNWFRTNVWDRIVSIFSSIGTSIGDAISWAFKGVINTALTFVSNFINNLIRGINGAIGLINKIPGVRLSTVREVALPRLARGGIVTQSTIAEIGENGAEAVIPLENNTEWIDKLADKINTASGGSNQPVQLVVKIGEETIATKVIDLINEKTQMSGRNAIIV